MGSSPAAVEKVEDGPPKPTRVTITNGLTDQLTVHCKSKDDGLGTKVLPNNASFSWHFTPSIFWNTLFFCSFDWEGNTGGLKRFDIYVEKRDLLRCLECNWLINQSGPCLYNKEAKAYDKCYSFRN
ncbi:unnamed protein product [Linum tenue]|uniref:S-protein homolog n=1 Tax=Linum tenue TaxID=586396 RepID=A0AAV0PJR7_9ROSI|nr:unnamed protein product [Linum tenue]